jgi:hypothetical protein
VGIIGEVDSMVSRTRASLAPAQPVLVEGACRLGMDADLIAANAALWYSISQYGQSLQGGTS